MWDLLVSNPPFFDHPSPQQEAHQPVRHQARHQSRLSLEDLFARARTLLRPGGSLQLILPTDQHQRLTEIGPARGWQLHRIRRVLPKVDRPAHRILSAWRISAGEKPAASEKPLPIRDQQGQYSEAYCELTKDFHPWI